MRVAVIGYRNHAKKIINLLNKNPKISEIIVYNYKLKDDYFDKKITYSNNINLCKKAVAVFVACPSKKHYYFTKTFLEKKKYVFCEKPPFSSNEQIRSIYNYKKKFKKLYFNFNYEFTDFFSQIRKEIKDKKNGKLISIDFSSSHGLAFKKGISWRFDGKLKIDNLLGNLGIHYLYFLKKVSPSIKIINTFYSSNVKKNRLDTMRCFLKNDYGLSANIFLSYASVGLKINIIRFTNCVLIINDKFIEKYYPRNTFNSKGNFTIPPKQIIKNTRQVDIKNSLEKSINYFINVIHRKNFFSKKNIQTALEVNKMILSSKILK